MSAVTFIDYIGAFISSLTISVRHIIITYNNVKFYKINIYKWWR